MLTAVFGAMFWFTTLGAGWRVAAAVWCASLIVTAIIAAAVWLLVD